VQNRTGFHGDRPDADRYRGDMRPHRSLSLVPLSSPSDIDHIEVTATTDDGSAGTCTIDVA
jgi:hypothetical protein